MVSWVRKSDYNCVRGVLGQCFVFSWVRNQIRNATDVAS